MCTRGTACTWSQHRTRAGPRCWSGHGLAWRHTPPRLPPPAQACTQWAPQTSWRVPGWPSSAAPAARRSRRGRRRTRPRSGTCRPGRVCTPCWPAARRGGLHRRTCPAPRTPGTGSPRPGFPGPHAPPLLAGRAARSAAGSLRHGGAGCDGSKGAGGGAGRVDGMGLGGELGKHGKGWMDWFGRMNQQGMQTGPLRQRPRTRSGVATARQHRRRKRAVGGQQLAVLVAQHGAVGAMGASALRI